ncbi:MAG: PhoH family protein [Oscillospiraceae bacterium]|nr:PhoH family protein [Oscillospiraceae bacterium]MBQ5341970.1 PhoH family protein [Oscillospiraceae bacterium]
MASMEFDLGSAEKATALSGILDQNIRLLESEFNVSVIGRGQSVSITGEQGNVTAASQTVEQMIAILNAGGILDDQAVRYCVNMVKSGEKEALAALNGECVLVTAKGKPIKAKTIGQKNYIDAIRKNSIVFGIGPAGTGKTYLSVVMAVSALKNHEVSRIILTRPAVEAGEKLGFLPGDLQTKIDPYLRPLYDALFDTMGPEGYEKQVERGIIEVAPLAYMRGRTLDNSFVILDEAQNTTSEQMKMFLTRLGNGSKMVVNGDITQIDLPDGKKSGLIEATRILTGINGIEIIRFSQRDIVRNRLVTEIVKAYEKRSDQKQTKGKRKGQT